MRLANNSSFEWNRTLPQLNNALGFTRALDIALAETSARYMNPFVPMKDGPLSQTYETGADELGGFVKYLQIYSSYQYNGVDFNFSKEMHPLATYEWDKAMMLVYREQLTQEINQLRKRFAK